MAEEEKAAETWPTGALLADRFRVVRVLGRGGMGTVYEVIHEITKHRRALKTLHASARETPEHVDRFLREASAAGRIGNPHIVETFDAGVLESGEPYLAMELLEGETLADKLEREKRLDLEALVEIFAQACDAVQAAHDAGIVHRDLKPENLFLVKQKEGSKKPFVKILDFGISKFDPRHQLGKVTIEGAVIGTPYYMSPEQVRGDDTLDHRSDVYSLGVMLYEASSGEHPYPATTVTAMVAKVLEAEPRPLAEVAPDLPADLSALVMRALVKNVGGRLARASELGEGLRAIARGDEVPAIAPDVVTIPRPPAMPRSMSQVSARPNLKNSAVPARSVSPDAIDAGAQSAAVPAKAPARSSPLFAVVGGVLGAGVIAAIAVAVASREAPPHPTAALDSASSKPTASAAPVVAPSPSAVVASPVASASVASSASAPIERTAPSTKVVAAPTSRPTATANAASKPNDLASKGEFHP